MINGIINVYKEPGWTSSDVVVKLRHILGCRRVGHTGTLDPMASGVLPVCVGEATQLSDYITDKRKTYTAGFLPGLVTDTQDVTGNVLQRRECNVTLEQLQVVLEGFRGELMQVPPMYSALKHNGKKLYELARQGREVERKARGITVYSIEAKKAGEGFLLRIECSKGTYVRTLCHDIGAALGTGGCMSSLERTACDDFTTDSALTVGAIEAMVRRGDFSFIMPPESAVMKYPAVEIEQSFAFHFLNGLDADRRRFSCGGEYPGEGAAVRVRLCGSFCAMGRIKNGMLHMQNRFMTPEEARSLTGAKGETDV